MKIIGVILTWNNIRWIKHSLPQALEFCDEVILIEGCHSQNYPKHSTDGTYEYVRNFNHPRLRIFDFAQNDRYDIVQRRLRQNMPKRSQYWKPGNWVLYWDDDAFLFEEDLKKLKKIMLTTSHDTIAFRERYFIFNFRFSLISNVVRIWPDGPHWNRITDGLFLKGVRNPYYKDGRRYDDIHWIDDVIQHHYSFVKLPAKMEARWAMSVEKGTLSSRHRFSEWMATKWKDDEDFFRQAEKILSILGLIDHSMEIYGGNHPEVLADHPWRNISDVRKQA